MRTLMIQKLAYHLADFTPRLQSNNRAIYQYCPIPLITYPLLEAGLEKNLFFLTQSNGFFGFFGFLGFFLGILGFLFFVLFFIYLPRRESF
jgi:hypothetical protein